MLEDLRNSSSFIEEEEPQGGQEQEAVLQQRSRQRRKETFLGMTAQQRFILSLMIFFMVCVLGVFALIASGSINLGF